MGEVIALVFPETDRGTDASETDRGTDAPSIGDLILANPAAAHVAAIVNLAMDEAHNAIAFHDLPPDLGARLAVRAAVALAVHHLGEEHTDAIVEEAFAEADALGA